MTTELFKRVTELAEADDVEGLTELLLEWPEQDSQWLLFIDSRLMAPSSTKEQKNRLKQKKAEALASNPALSYDDLFSKPEAAAEEVNVETEEFIYTQQDKRRFDIIETIEEFEDWEFDDIADYLASLNYGDLDAAVQHVINVAVYSFLNPSRWQQPVDGKLTEVLAGIVSHQDYQQWHRSVAPESVLANSDFAAKDLKRICQLEDEVELISRRDYFVYLLAKGDDDYRNIDEFLDEIDCLHDFERVASDADVRDFEAKHGVTLPSDLVSFYQTLAGLHRGANDLTDIPSLRDLDQSLDPKRPKWNRLNGMGLIDMLEAVWGNSTDHFTHEVSGFDAAQISELNSRYKSIGYLGVDDNVSIVVYFDEQQRFGAVWYNQDDGVLFEDYLRPLLQRSHAQYGCCQLLTVIRFWINARLMADGLESLIASLKAS